MPVEGETTEFMDWEKAIRHLFVTYTDFEALLLKSTKTMGVNIAAI